ncbi:MAG TPA: hypothetical protein DDY58_15265 [Terrisporobacter glycolicus]|uniref:hypothetical protein n=1 Tax=Terrisporobacter TaxID=1505652 RepID=UPI000E865F52|nr:MULTISPECIES: hypothetical protein [Terrisporobacter]HBI93658.1 hypothetical protein [Terrisporobacter hibernicus]
MDDLTGIFDIITDSTSQYIENKKEEGCFNEKAVLKEFEQIFNTLSKLEDGWQKDIAFKVTQMSKELTIKTLIGE